jgi:hypothetical protein
MPIRVRITLPDEFGWLLSLNARARTRIISHALSLLSKEKIDELIGTSHWKSPPESNANDEKFFEQHEPSREKIEALRIENFEI